MNTLTDNIRNLTVEQLREFFVTANDETVAQIIFALRAVAGDTESMAKLQALHVTIDQPLENFLRCLALEIFYNDNELPPGVTPGTRDDWEGEGSKEEEKLHYPLSSRLLDLI